MLVEEVDAPLIDTLRDRLADLVRAPPLNHVQRSPPVLGLGAGRRTHEQAVSQLTLQAVLLDVVGQESRHLSALLVSRREEKKKDLDRVKRDRVQAKLYY